MSETIRPSKEQYLARIRDEMDRHLPATDWNLRQKLALTCRMLARDGHGSGLAGQITARAKETNSYWTIRLGLGFDEISAGNLLRCDDDLRLIDGEGMPNPATRFHLWVYRARPDVNCIVHTHPPHVSALSMIGEELAVAHMDTIALHGDCAYLPRWPGVPVADEEGRIISEALKDKRAILLAHHGQLVACASVEEAAVLAITIERAAKLQLLAQAVGPIKPIEPALAQEAHDYRLNPRHIGATFNYHARQVLKNDPECLNG
jgi:L-fuculose-phosphate aldolase